MRDRESGDAPELRHCHNLTRTVASVSHLRLPGWAPGHDRCAAVSIGDAADHSDARERDPRSHVDRYGFDRNEAECTIEGLSNQAGVALEALYADGARISNAAIKQRSPDATTYPVRMSGEVPNMAEFRLNGRAPREI